MNRALSSDAEVRAKGNGHALRVDRVSHSFGTSRALDDVSLDIGAGELVALLGPSGCGKTTLLRAIAGFVTPQRGAILIDGERIDDVPARRRGVGIMFQSYALFPHMTVEQNIAYGLDARRVPRATARERVAAMLRLVQLEPLLDRFPRELSGGQQQRVALARALAIEPRMLLLDEPFAALDKNLRLDMQIEIRRLQQQIGVTTIMVTHDQEEAMSMADRIAVMREGCVEQFARPTEVYDRPASPFINRFVGSANLIDGTVAHQPDGTFAVEVPGSGAILVAAAATHAPGAPVALSIRPENLYRLDSMEHGRLAGEVSLVMPLGGISMLEVRLPGGQILKLTELRKAGASLPRAGDRVHLALVSDEAASLFPRTAPDIPHRP
jgi:putative spermidine/putrescine transport system ATP-binding protein